MNTTKLTDTDRSDNEDEMKEDDLSQSDRYTTEESDDIQDHRTNVDASQVTTDPEDQDHDQSIELIRSQSENKPVTRLNPYSNRQSYTQAAIPRRNPQLPHPNLDEARIETVYG